jgi:hypothetical protein
MSNEEIAIYNLQSLNAKLDKLIELQERPYKEQEMLLIAKKQEKMREYITDLIDPSHYE